MDHLSKHPLHFILIDDDPLFAKIMANVAYQEGIYLDCVSSLEELFALADVQTYDAAIIDFNLGEMNGLQVAEQLRSRLGLVPTVLVSQSTRHDIGVQNWPSVVRCFQHKSKGYHAILGAAKQLGSAHVRLVA